MGRIKKPKLKYILLINDDVIEFFNKTAMIKFIKELQIKDYKISVVDLV